mmetsp:Transcript_7723/g.6903  ORF Transcript_7723/g.6903 Transcript_7723/m.6903 type:complete len:185 (-) Transcript_7723:125-679(-)|eukprot:CAMPEP_0196761866 /NCGR_PEP_ID=MMETSP1095-20130614/1172_1 /TAXON_ID=96789 ORGANISM="Chromulina nebulosa, Strain UTEXLB2642" /NCGR_SAMPLE_ID=MMETSP1095 /ASSEMBLY_ACC=CAM_ASM_000446 /LENGTH=184 /DNA_ID=CAMNT_0042111909 /DNA_START=172 /DNA_END=729 /DNA_ORIENTATION=+
MPTDNNLHKAAHKGDLEECKKLIEEPGEDEEAIDVNEPGASDRRPLHRSAGGGHAELCEYFLSKGAVIDAVDKSGRTALHWAAISGHTEVVKLLLARGANVLAQSSNKMNALHMSCEGGRVETVRALMEFVGTDEEKKTGLTMAKNNEDKTAWDIAAGASNKAVCQVLKELGDANGASSSCIIS